MAAKVSAATKCSKEEVQFWKIHWDEKPAFWHIDAVNKNLAKYFNRLVPNSPSSPEDETRTIFVPLCGKTRDIAYLLSRGLKVFGLEGVKQAIEALDAENSFDLKFDKAQSIYYTEDRQLQIYFGDMYTCPIEKWGPFDFVWDRASFCAVEYSFRPSYKEIMQRSVDGRSFRYLLEVVHYDKAQFGGPPRSVTAGDMQEFFADWAKLEVLSVNPLPVEFKIVNDSVQSGPSESVVYLLKSKH